LLDKENQQRFQVHNGSRRHNKDYEHNPDSSVAMNYIAMTKNILYMLENKGQNV